MLKQWSQFNGIKRYCLLGLFRACVTFCDEAPGLGFPLAAFPVTKAEPEQRNRNGNEQGLADFDIPFAQQIPGDDAKENAHSFGKREAGLMNWHERVLVIVKVHGVKVLPGKDPERTAQVCSICGGILAALPARIFCAFVIIA